MQWLIRFLNGRGGPLIAATCLVAAACGSSNTAPSSQASNGSALVVNMAVGPATLDPAEECGTTDFTITNGVYSQLTQYGSKPGPDGTTQADPAHIVPYLAKSWNISSDGLVYTFHLRPGLKFPNGDPVDSQAVKFSLERSVTMNGCGGYFIYDGIYTPPLIKSIATPDPNTVVITLSRPDPNVLQDWAQPAASIVDPAVVNAHGGVVPNQVNQWMAGHVAGYGPFLLQSYEPNKRAVLVANPNFFEKSGAQKVVINFINSDPTLLLEAKSGAADVTLGLAKQSAHSLASNPNLRVIADPSPETEWLGLANNMPPFNNQKLREALSYAVPYQQILSNIAFGYGKLFFGPFPPSFPGYNAQIEKPRPYDLAKARQLLQASGVHTPIGATLVIQEGNPIDEQVATAVQGVWSQLGVNLTVQQLSPTDYINALEGHKVQAFIRLDGPGVIDPGYYLGYDMKCGISFNLTATCIPQADQLLDQARQTTDPATRQQLWDQIERLWIADTPKIPVYGDEYITVLNKRVRSYFYSDEINYRTWSK